MKRLFINNPKPKITSNNKTNHALSKDLIAYIENNKYNEPCIGL